MKKLAVFLCALLLLPMAYGANPQSHGYMWIMDLNGVDRGNVSGWQSIERSQLEGGASEMMYMEYIGFENGSHVFQFFGGNLVDMRIYIEGRNGTGALRTLGYSVRSDINYSGKLIVRNVTYYPPAGGEAFHYYGITELYANVSGFTDMEMKDIREHGEWRYEMEKKGNISIYDFHTTFSPPLPFYPAERRDIDMVQHIRLNYSGRRVGHIHYRALYPSGEPDSLDAYVGKHISGFEGIEVYSRFFSNGTMFVPSPLGITEIVDITPYRGYMLDFEDSAFEMRFWQRYNSSGIVSIAQSSPLGGYVWSESASKEAVERYLSNKAAYTPLPETEKSGGDEYILYVLLAVISITIPIMILVFRRKTG